MKKQFLYMLTGTLLCAMLNVPNSLNAQVPNYVPTNGLVGWWPFNGNANDESSNGNNGTVNGATLTTDRFGVVDKAYSFDGNSNRIQVNDANSLDIQNGQSLTISAWIKHDLSSSNIDRYIISKYSGLISTGPQFGLGTGVSGQAYTTTQIAAGITNHNDLRGDNIINDGLWHHLVYIWHNGSNSVLIVDNLIDTIETHNLNGSIINSLNMQFGCGANLAQYYKGNIDDIGIWNRALTACEIQDLHNAELNSVNVSAGPDQELCQGQSTSLFATGASTYSWSNNIQNGVGFLPAATNQYVVTGTDANGCIGIDSVVVTVNNHSSSTQTQTALDSYTWPVNGQTYVQSGTYTAVIPNAIGCDSTVTLNLSLSFTGIDQLQLKHDKKLVKITDLNGRETPYRKNTVLLFIYEDGTVERVLEVD